uniref:Retroviral polymerase SH3-like domain-containing protein n=1 Tax=Tanacetum cinerariifolium TaxID=118510 RepID=A0A6L2NG11_TANCI|nr:hypothetical protein [Tanacetum cinerariifolium]
MDKTKEKEDQCILVGYSTQSKGYRVYNKRTRMIVESINIRFDEIKEVKETSVANKTSGLSTSPPSTHTNVHADENNNDQAEEGEKLQDNEFTSPFVYRHKMLLSLPHTTLEAMADSAWIEAMQEELHQFDRL